jgi:CHAT domain-containing protein
LLRHCYELLIAPFDGLIAAESSLIIVPDRDLFALPFAALLDGDDKHLVEKHAVRVVPSAGTLIELEQRVSSRPKSDAQVTALVVGNPDFHGWKSKLPGAEAEAKEVCKRLQQQGQTTYLSRGEATTANVVEALGACTYVHLATHGAADGVYLSGHTEAEGKLTMAEVQELDLLRARLVVLSECDSFKGELKADGVIGITRAFVAAGAPTLVASLWKVSDVATRKLMIRFYDALLGPVAAGDVAVALQVAMVSMCREGWPVSDWAAFVVYGLASATRLHRNNTA